MFLVCLLAATAGAELFDETDIAVYDPCISQVQEPVAEVGEGARGLTMHQCIPTPEEQSFLRRFPAFRLQRAIYRQEVAGMLSSLSCWRGPPTSVERAVRLHPLSASRAAGRPVHVWAGSLARLPY